MDDELFFEKTLKELGTVRAVYKLFVVVGSNAVFQLLGEDQRLMVVFQMLVMATQVDKSFPFPASA